MGLTDSLDSVSREKDELVKNNNKLMEEIAELLRKMKTIRDEQLENIRLNLDSDFTREFPGQDSKLLYEHALTILMAYTKSKARGKTSTKQEMDYDWDTSKQELKAQREAGATLNDFLAEFCRLASNLLQEGDFSQFGHESKIANTMMHSILKTTSLPSKVQMLSGDDKRSVFPFAPK